MDWRLKNCPFCGSSANEEVLEDGSDLSKAYCENPDCGAAIALQGNLLHTRKLWNRRVKA